MKKSTVLLSAISAVVLGLPGIAAAYDNDPGYAASSWKYSGADRYADRTRGFDGSWYGGGSNYSGWNLKPLYYRPTQRYYGPGYTVSYRYVPVYRTDSTYSATVNGAANFRTEAFHLPTEDAVGWGAGFPRMTVKDPKSNAPRTAVTSIVRKKTVPTSAPAITPSTTTPATTPANP